MSLTYMNRRGKLFHPELHQPTYKDKWVWLFGRTPQMSNYTGRKIWF